MDECIGEVLKEIDDLGLANNTIVLFQSDHGHSTEVRTFSGGGSAGPYRGAKACLFEGGIRVPSIVRWPKQVPAGEVRGQLAVGCDWFPTFAEWCNIPLPGHKLDGKSIAAVVKSGKAKSPHNSFYWQLGRQWAVRQGQWKLLGNPVDRSNKAPLTNDDRLFLCDLSKDVSERRNIAGQHPDVVKRLQSLRQTYLRDIESSQ